MGHRQNIFAIIRTYDFEEHWWQGAQEECNPKFKMYKTVNTAYLQFYL